MKQAIDRFGDQARLAFAKIGMLMAASGRSGKPLHPTNLHVNQALFPNDTVQSRLPDPEWLEDWLTHKIRFTAEWESRVVGGILRNLSSLFERPFESVQQLNRYRKGAGCRHRVMERHELPRPEFERKLCPPEQLAERLSALARPLVMTNGCFDILHRGMSPIWRKRALGASLVVALNTDASVRRQGKG